jgi:hypothetical protein
VIQAVAIIAIIWDSSGSNLARDFSGHLPSLKWATMEYMHRPVILLTVSAYIQIRKLEIPGGTSEV